MYGFEEIHVYQGSGFYRFVLYQNSIISYGLCLVLKKVLFTEGLVYTGLYYMNYV